MAHLVLLADDSITIRKVVELTFQGTEIRVDAVGSGREAIERLETIRPDLVLADVDMPEPSGYELCRHVKGSDHPVPVLLLTGAFEPFDPAEAERCGADGHLIKPFDSGYLVKQVEEFLQRPVPVTEPEAETSGLAEDDAGEAEAFLEELGGEASFHDGPADEIHQANSVAEPAPAGATLETGSLSPREEVREAVRELSEEIIREIAWEVVPELAEAMIRKRIRELEQE